VIKTVLCGHEKIARHSTDGKFNLTMVWGVANLKGQSHEIGEGCRWCYWIDLKFVQSRLTFIFNLKLILKSNFFKMASVRERFSPGFPLGGRFSAE
jgi:hypothetical protein